MFYNSIKNSISSIVNVVRLGGSSKLKPKKSRNILTLEEMVGLPQRPKKPLTPFFRYLQEMRPKIKRQHPKARVTELTRIVSERWRTADPDLKERFSEQYKLEMKDYLKRKAQYEEMLTKDDRSDINEVKELQVKAKQRRLCRKRIQKLGKPKKPMTGYLRFVATENRKKAGNITQGEWSQKCSAKWASLEPKVKMEFVEEGRKALRQYQNELQRWEQKMIKLGNVDVVRRSSLSSYQNKRAAKKKKGTFKESK